MTAVLLTFDDIKYLTRCEATIHMLRDAGNFSGPLEVVGPPGAAFSRDYGVHIRTLREVLSAGTQRRPSFAHGAIICSAGPTEYQGLWTQRWVACTIRRTWRPGGWHRH